MSQRLASKRNIAWAYHQAACKCYWPYVEPVIPTFTPGDWFVYLCVLTLHILSLTPDFLPEQSESVLTKCERSEDYRAKIKGGLLLTELAGVAACSFHPHTGTLKPRLYPPSFRRVSALTCLTLPNCNLSGSALLEQEDRGGRRGPAEYFDTAQLNSDWTKTTTVAPSRTDATIRQVEKETGGWGGGRGWNYVLGVVFIKKKKEKKRILINCPFRRRFVNALYKAWCGVPRLCSNLAAIEDAR